MNENNIQYKLGKTVTISFSVKKTDESAFTGNRLTLGKMVSGWRPYNTRIAPAGGNSILNYYVDKTVGTLLIQNNGNVIIDLVNQECKEIQINVVYLAY